MLSSMMLEIWANEMDVDPMLHFFLFLNVLKELLVASPLKHTALELKQAAFFLFTTQPKNVKLPHPDSSLQICCCLLAIETFPQRSFLLL
jgi:hypothetical protein